MRNRPLNAAVLTAFLAALEAAPVHRFLHDAEEAAEMAAAACPHRDAPVHFCAPHDGHEHEACVLCAAGAVSFAGTPAAAALAASPPPALHPLDESPPAAAAPLAELHAPRGPPSA